MMTNFDITSFEEEWAAQKRRVINDDTSQEFIDSISKKQKGKKKGKSKIKSIFRRKNGR